jgi:hypothetical protein
MASVYINPPPDRIVYCYSQAHPGGFENVEFVQGLPDLEQFDPCVNNLLVLDDLMHECENSKEMLGLFTVDSHHKNISTFLITQNLFSRGKYSRTISLNCSYLVIFNNPRDRSQIQYIARQMYPTNPGFLVEAYEDATENKHGFLFIDLTQGTENSMRIQANIFDKTRIIYREKK